MPPRWPSNSREVMGHSFWGNAGQYFWTGASRSNLPRSQSCRMAVAVIGLEIDPSRKSVEDVAGAESSRSDMPNPADHTGSPSRTTAAPMPGTLLADMKLETAFSIAARLSGERLFCWAAALAAATRDRTSKHKNGTRNELAFVSRARCLKGAPRTASLTQRASAGNGGVGVWAMY